MFDGKSTNVLSSHLSNKVIATSSCHLCFDSSKDFSSNHSRTVDKKVLDLGCSVLHCWIRSMEYTFKMAVRVNIPYKVTESSEAFKKQKNEFRDEFKAKLNLDLFTVQHGGGTSNTGNNARKFLEHCEVTAAILNIKSEIV